jgi:hypothetical protein
LPSQVRVAHVANFSLGGDSRTKDEIDWPGPGKSVYDCNHREHNKNVRDNVRLNLGHEPLYFSLIQDYVLMQSKRD